VARVGAVGSGYVAAMVSGGDVGVLDLSRSQILRFRHRADGLVERTPRSPTALVHAAHVGLTDSMPRAALLSLHARLDGVTADVLDDPSLTQVWGPRFSTYVVGADDVAPFTLGRLPTDARGLERATRIAADLARLLDGEEPIPMGEAGRALGINPNALRYASPTGTVRIRWDGARQPTITVAPAPDVDPRSARHELLRRYLRRVGPADAGAFAAWAGIRPRAALTTFDELSDELLPVRTPIGEAWMLEADEEAIRADGPGASGVRLLPSGDASWLLWGASRDLLVDDDARRDELWTPRVWPGALLVDGEIVGTWRRAQSTATVAAWRRLSRDERAAIEVEAASMPLPDLTSPVRVTWAT
jgi:hypothetical protein